ncbi:GNAT family N-acetyltransferase [Thalassotalea sp. Y01]|uniref:GNAT family N-acetyltransferase n=1 Tax=Thalassotalea sp. Y01 TaxID=2729613 RepID=UPI00145E931D|nr:GNAT family N-acetyltransferase [Thalassotalea sp. Y01]NMP16520.1 GNAT family N-acetyltransferase [Thalassotalea sp. Y01]
MHKVIGITSKSGWDKYISRASRADIYHTYEYHQVHASLDGGKPTLWVSEVGEQFIALPLLERNIPHVKSLKDFTSVYGYPGLITNTNNTSTFTSLFDALVRGLNNQGYISIFSRMNSFTVPEEYLDQVCTIHGETVNVDLLASESTQTKAYRTNHRRDIKKLERNHFVCEFVEINDCLNEFIDVYNSTMASLKASNYYLFPREYYLNLFRALNKHVKLVKVHLNNEVACMGIFFFYEGTIQYHLGGTASNYYKFAPTKLMFEYIRKYGNVKGYERFHLGGGLGGGNDNLFNFKKGFSKDIKKFYLLKQVLNERKYEELSLGKKSEHFFPLYRV